MRNVLLLSLTLLASIGKYFISQISSDVLAYSFSTRYHQISFFRPFSIEKSKWGGLKYPSIKAL